MSMIDSSVAQLAAALERTINLAISADPAAQKKLNNLEGCILAIEILKPRQNLFFRFSNQQIHIIKSADTASVTLSGSLMSFIKLALSKDKSQFFKRREISLSGDAVRAQQIQLFMSKLKIDWEALLAEVIGDAPAHFLGTTVRQGLQFGRNLSQSFLTDLEEYLKYELKLLPNKTLAKKRFEAIDQLRLATDRLEARIKKIIQQGNKT